MEYLKIIEDEMNHTNKQVGALGEKIAARIYRDRNYRVRFPNDGFSWYDFHAKQPGNPIHVAVQVKATLKNYAEGYPESIEYIERQLERFATSGFDEYQLVVVSAMKGYAYIFGRLWLQSCLYEAEQDSRHYESVSTIGLIWRRSMNHIALTPEEIATFGLLEAGSDTIRQGNLFYDPDR